MLFNVPQIYFYLYIVVKIDGCSWFFAFGLFPKVKNSFVQEPYLYNFASIQLWKMAV